MWTSSYLPGRRALTLGAALVAVVVALLLFGLHRKGCPRRARPAPAARNEPIPVRLHLAGTPGACVRIDGQVVGPLPAEVELLVRRPQRVFVHACKRGFLDFAGELELRPGTERTEQIILPSYRLLRQAHRPQPPCPCQG